MLKKEIVDFKGLFENDAIRLMKIYGKNVLKEKKRTPAILILLSQFKDVLVIILIIATIISAMLSEFVESIAIITVVLMNGIFGFMQEYKTEKTLEALKKLSAPYCKVMRNGDLKKIKAELVVPGDILVLEAGDRVAADCIILKAQGYSVDESMLTGESDSVLKEGLLKKHHVMEIGLEEIIKVVATLGKDKDKVSSYMGTLVLTGGCNAIVIDTGMNTEMGKIAKMIDEVETLENPLQRKLNNLGKLLAVGCVLICALVSTIGILRGEDVFDMLLSGISLAVASIPESLPAVVMVSLAVGVQRMLKRSALIKRLPAVETLGMANVICTDKTGTLTQNKMEIKNLYIYDREIRKDSNEWEKAFKSSENIINVKDGLDRAGVLQRFLCVSALCNNSNFDTGDSFEKALLNLIKDVQINPIELRNTMIREEEIPFSSEKKYMGVVVRGKDCKYLMVKGAPEIIMKKCTKVICGTEEILLSEGMKKRIQSQNDRLTSNAFRVIGFAMKKISGSLGSNVEELVTDMTFIALAGAYDPPREDVADAIEKCFILGIKPIMITGDHKNTAVAIAKETGIFRKGDEVITGEELENSGEIELCQRIDKVSVFARVSPRHKLKIVRLLKTRGAIVAMTGDGVNDAPAVKAADIGIAMGINGTDVTKEAASIVLLDDRFSSIMDAVIEGRIIYLNIRKAIMYLLSCNVGEVVTMFLGTILGFPVILLPIQILWVNLVTDGLPAIGLSCDIPDKNAVVRNKSYNTDNILHDGLLGTIFIRGIIMGILTLGVFVYFMAQTSSIDIARTNAFFTMILLQLVYAVECRGRRGKSARFMISVIMSFLLAMAVLFIPMFRNAFSLVIPKSYDWYIISSVSIISSAFAVIFRKIRNK